jgi:hypothetical protein
MKCQIGLTTGCGSNYRDNWIHVYQSFLRSMPL